MKASSSSKSTAKAKTKPRIDSHEDALQKLQELQRQAETMDLSQAMAAMQAAKFELEKIKKAQQDAAERVSKAKEQLQEAEKKGSVKGNYSNKEYWDSRYSENVAADATKADRDTAKINLKSSHISSNTYEWYLDFNKYSQLLMQDIPKASSKPVLVPGCGNSTMCEDLYDLGYRSIAGMDYSENVIKVMQNRSDRPITYFQADARSMPVELTGTYTAAVDKGTLDAIASADGDNEQLVGQECLKSAQNYIFEMLRVLDASGVLIIMSTMPPDIFAKVALSHTNLACVPVIERSSDSDKLDCVRYTKLQTAEGGAIFYYAICKRLYAVESAKKESAMDVMDGIRALLNQAKEARSQLDDAAAKQAKAQADMDSTLNKKSELEELLATSPISNGELVDEDNSKVLLDLLEVMPKVDLEVQHNESLLAAEGYAVATYRFYQAGAKQTVWLDDDTICLVGTSLTDQTHSTLLCTPRNDAKIITPLAYSAGETPYEVFEYTEQPLLDTCGKILIGRIKVALPSYGGTFRLQYVRTVKLPTAHRTTEQTGTTNLAFTEHRILLAESELLSLRFPIYNAPPDKLVKGVSTIRRRSTAEIISNRVGNILLENMKSISTIYANFLIPGADNVNDNVNSNHFISRVMAWVYDVAEDETSSKETELVIEFDVVKYNSRFISKQTKYSRCRFESPCRFLVAQAYGELVESGRIVLRLPYEAVTSSENRPIQKNYEGEVVVRCSFCCNNLTSSKTIQRIRNLPSGIFDTMMHDFICCEEIPTGALTSNDVVSPVDAMLIGSVYGSVNISSILKSEILLSCKTSSTLIDTAVNGMLATVPIEKKGEKGWDELLDARVVIDVNTCIVKCRRCSNYLGDAQLREKEISLEASGFCGDCTNGSKDIEVLLPEDVAECRFLLSNVVIEDSLGLHAFEEEKVVAAILRNLSISLGVNTFLVYIRDRKGCKLVARTKNFLGVKKASLITDEGILIKVISMEHSIAVKDAQSDVHSESATVKFKDSIKVSFRVNSIQNIFRGKEGRVPVEHCLFFKVKNVLESRARYMGPAPSKEHSLAALLL